MLDYIKLIFLLATCFVIILALVNLRGNNIKKEDLKFLLSSIFVTLILAFIIVIKPHHMLRDKLNISNLIIYIFYFVIVSNYLLRFRKILLKFKFVLIIISYTFFGLANAVDLLSDGKLIVCSYNEIIEDIFHIFGIVFWLMFFIDYLKRIKIKYL